MKPLAIIATHPVQYHAPWYRYLAQQMEIEVLYAHRQDARGQAEAGFAVELEWDVPLLDGYPHRFLHNVSRRPGVSYFRGCDTPELYDLIGRRRYAAVLATGWNRKCFAQAIAACRRQAIPILMRGDSQMGTPRRRLWRMAKYLPYRLLLPRIDAHLYVGQRNREYLRHYGVPEHRLFFSPHCVDNDTFSRAAQAPAEATPSALREKLGIPEQAFVIGYVGKLIEIKRPLDVVAATMRPATDPELHLVVVGDGPLRGEVRAAASRSGNIHLVGFRNQRELPRWYRLLDAVVLPGFETWGLVVNEAAACGIPAIVSDAVGCAPDLIEEGRTGFTYRQGSIVELLERIRALAALYRRARSSIQTALREKMEIYSYSRATRGLQEALDALHV